MLEIVFNEISASEMTQLPISDQLTLLVEFKVSEADLEKADDERFGIIERKGRILHRFRTQHYRIYFEILEGNIIVHRILHKNSFSDFKFRTKLSLEKEDQILAESPHFWKLIEEAENAKNA